MSKIVLFKLKKDYTIKEQLNAYLISALYQVIGLAGVTILLINIVSLDVPHLDIYLLIAFLPFSFILYRGTIQFIKQLKKIKETEIDYLQLFIQNMVAKEIILVILLVVTYIIDTY